MGRAGLLVTAGALVTSAVVWLRVNNPWEGPTLFKLSTSHGVTLADLPTLPVFAAAGWLVWRAR